MPIKMAAFTSPLKYNISENMRERNAAENNKISATPNFLNMSILFLLFYEQKMEISI